MWTKGSKNLRSARHTSAVALRLYLHPVTLPFPCSGLIPEESLSHVWVSQSWQVYLGSVYCAGYSHFPSSLPPPQLLCIRLWHHACTRTHTRGISVYKRGRLEATHEVNPRTPLKIQTIFLHLLDKRRENQRKVDVCKWEERHCQTCGLNSILYRHAYLLFDSLMECISLLLFMGVKVVHVSAWVRGC